MDFLKQGFDFLTDPILYYIIGFIFFYGYCLYDSVVSIIDHKFWSFVFAFIPFSLLNLLVLAEILDFIRNVCR